MSRNGPTINRAASRQDYGTPDDFLDAVETTFGSIGFDLAAVHSNRVVDRYFSPSDNSLIQDWHKIRVGKKWLWLNPPFSDIPTWARKCAQESAKGARIMFLVPASVGSNWFRDHVWNQARILALNGRITFVGESEPYPKDCMLCLFDIRKPALFDVWSWMKPGKAKKG